MRVSSDEGGGELTLVRARAEVGLLPLEVKPQLGCTGWFSRDGLCVAGRSRVDGREGGGWAELFGLPSERELGSAHGVMTAPDRIASAASALPVGQEGKPSASMSRTFKGSRCLDVD